MARPAPGASEELFLLEGRRRRGQRLVALAGGLRAPGRGAGGLVPPAPVLPAEAEGATGGQAGQSPYPGLRAFAAADAGRYFGREREGRQALPEPAPRRAPRCRHGPVGDGQELVSPRRVLPHLPPSWSVVSLRPGPEPLRALDAALVVWLPNLLVLDQLEELFTLCPDGAEREAFAAASGASPAAGRRIRVVLVVRDGLPRPGGDLPGLRGRLARGSTRRRPRARRTRPDARRARPAGRLRLRGPRPPPGAPGRCPCSGRPGRLPLLAFTASRLWELRDRDLCLLLPAGPTRPCGVGGALVSDAEATLESMSGPGAGLRPPGFPRPGERPKGRGGLSPRRAGAGPARERTGPARPSPLIQSRPAASEAEGAGIRLETATRPSSRAWPRTVRRQEEDLGEGAAPRPAPVGRPPVGGAGACERPPPAR